MSLITYQLEYSCHLAQLCHCPHCRHRAYVPTSNTPGHDNHKKMKSWVSFLCFPIWVVSLLTALCAIVAPLLSGHTHILVIPIRVFLFFLLNGHQKFSISSWPFLEKTSTDQSPKQKGTPDKSTKRYFYHYGLDFAPCSIFTVHVHQRLFRLLYTGNFLDSWMFGLKQRQ